MWIILILSALELSAPALAKTKMPSAATDHVLDRLEKRLLDEEATDLSRDEIPKKTTEETAKKESHLPGLKVRKQSFKKEKVTTEPNEVVKIQGIGHMITQLESDIDQFAQSVQKSSQTLIEEAKIDNYIDLEARLSTPDHAAIHSLSVKIDGYKIYQTQDSAGIWMPTSALPLYSGPFPPGTHRLDVEAKLTRKMEQPMPINEDVYHFLNKTFDISVPITKEKKRYIIQILPPNNETKTFDATLEEAT